MKCTGSDSHHFPIISNQSSLIASSNEKFSHYTGFSLLAAKSGCVGIYEEVVRLL
jgi:hypothetical protein